MLIAAALMQDQLGRSPLTIRHKRNLCIDDLGEEIMIAFGEYLDLSLPGCLGYETTTLPHNLQDEVRGQLIAAHVAVEYFRINLYHLALRCQHHGSALSDGVQIRRNLLRRRPVQVSEDDHRELLGGVLRQHGVVDRQSGAVVALFLAVNDGYTRAVCVAVFERSPSP